MEKFMESMPGNIQLLYADLLQTCLRHAAPSGRGRTFVKKEIDSKIHWYMQLTVGNRKTQHYLGPESAELQEKMNKEKALWKEAEPEVEERQKLVSALVAGGAYSLSVGETRVLEILERAGVFLAGGTLVGSQAFRIMGNLLGVRWDSHAIATQDIDIADTNTLPVGLIDKNVDLQKALLESELGVFAIPALDRKSPSTSFKVRNEALQVDILTPLHGKTSSKPVYLSNLNTYAHPLRFLDYLLEDIQPAVAVTKAGILVNIPAPARYAFHKLMTASRRPSYWQTKSSKDISQARQLFTALLDLRPGDITLAKDAINKQPDAFKKGVKDSWKKLGEDIQLRLKKETGIRF
jgi:hypothetical protein